MKNQLKKVINFCRGFWLLFKLKYIRKQVIKQSDVVFFFPFYHTGGAERVHLDIVRTIPSKTCCVIFTHGSATKNFLEDFKKSAEVIELNSILNKRNPFISKKLQEWIVKSINTNSSIKKVFSSNTNYFYELLPKLNNHIEKLDLIHALSKNDERSGVLAKTSTYIDKRILINKKGKEDLLKIYKEFQVKSSYIDNIQIISNGVNIPDIDVLGLKNKSYDPIRVGFVGRWSAEKRPDVFLDIAKQVSSKYPNIKFVMAGTGMRSNIKKIQTARVEFLGEITNLKALHSLYHAMNILIICSEYEGFPMVLMESMPFGVVPICANVGGISEHISNEENGILIDDMDSGKLSAAFVKHIENLVKNKSVLTLLSEQASDYAVSHFDISSFTKAYQELLN